MKGYSALEFLKGKPIERKGKGHRSSSLACALQSFQMNPDNSIRFSTVKAQIVSHHSMENRCMRGVENQNLPKVPVELYQQSEGGTRKRRSDRIPARGGHHVIDTECRDIIYKGQGGPFPQVLSDYS